MKQEPVMLSYEFNPDMNQNIVTHKPFSVRNRLNYIPKPGSKTQKLKSEQASKKHAVAEQERRRRINAHIKTLRHLLLPHMSSKTVKASILTETVRQVKELRKKALEQQEGNGSGRNSFFMFPGENDEVEVKRCDGGDGRVVVKATVCCEDRPGFNRDLTEAIRSVGAEAVKAEMATIGGRTRAEVVVEWRSGGGGDEESMRRALTGLVQGRGLGQIVGLSRTAGLVPDGYSNKWAGLNGSFNRNGQSFY